MLSVDLCDQYRCDCDSGYSENELDECCEDLNQCVSGIPDLGVSPEDVCAPNFFCINSCVGFECVCGDGFEEQNGNCVPETETTVVDTTTPTPATTKDQAIKIYDQKGFVLFVYTGSCHVDKNFKILRARSGIEFDPDV